MSLNKPDRLIINSPYEEPKHYWKYDRETRTFDKADGRRPAGYLVASSDSKAFDDPGRFVEIPLVNKIRPRIAEWRKAGYPGATSVTKRLLEHWNNPEERDYRRFFFCQLEAIETLIWLAEAPAADRVGIHIVSDGGSFQRLCSKLATGTGKTVVMAMLIAWQFINKASFPQDNRYSKNVFIVAPNLTVRNRLQVLNPSASDNYYEAFNIIPAGMIEKLRLGKVLIRNWHILQWETEEKLSKKKSVDKRGPKSDEAYVREILQDMSTARNILVINDEAHHAWRIAPGEKVKGLSKEDVEEATKWIGGLDRIQNARGILKCYDFSATPFVPSGKKATEEALFDWIVSDFGLNDAIESGLVKTPRVVIRDDTVPDTESYKSRLYHIYNDEEVKDDLNRKATPESSMPSLVVNAYHLLGADWLETYKLWMEAGHKVPPVMISVANRTETAARIKYSFDHHNVPIDDLCDPDKTLHIDSKVLAAAESGEPLELNEVADPEEENGEETKKLTKKQQAEFLRQQVDTVGQFGQPGGKIRNVISVGMLSEGWDAKTVTHIMGLRAFSSQLLCEQVVGRGLRRTAYDINSDGLFDPEHVNIFGVPFTFLPHEDTGDTLPPPPPPKTRIEPISDKQEFEIKFPNVIRIEHVFRPQLSLDMSAIAVLELDASNTIKLADLAAVVEGKPDIQTITSINLEKLAEEYRLQKVMFEVTKRVYEQMSPAWKGSKENLLGQLFKLVDDFLKSDKIVILPESYNQNSLKRRLVLALNMATVVNHIWGSIQDSNTTVLTPVFDQDHPIKSTGDMNAWYTGKPNEYTVKSHINYCVFDSAWESCEAFHLDNNNGVMAWVKNDHIGFEIYYVWQGVVRKYRPDFIIRLVNDLNLVLEVKGQETEQDKTKRRFMEEWVQAVNNHGGFGEWAFAVSRDPGDVEGIIARYSNRGVVEVVEPEEMNADLKVLKQFLEIPIGSSDGVFERFKQIPNADFRGEKQDRFLYVRGFRQNKVLLVAHADTVWDKYYKEPFTSKHEVIFHNGIVKSGTKGCGIGADDRAGCAILWLLKDMGHSLLITDGEEHGKFGSSWLMSHNRDIADEINNEHQFVIQFDRCNGADFKCYKVGTPEFKKYIEDHTPYGDTGDDRSTDICQLCESVTGVNLSIGYYNEHYSNEYLDLKEWENTLNVCRTWLAGEELPKFRRS